MHMKEERYCHKIRYYLLDQAEDYVFGLNDLADLAPYDSIRQELSDLTRKKLIDRLVTGIYWVKRSNRKCPDINDVVSAIARNNRWVIAPGTELARVALGLSGEASAVPCYLSSGPSTKYCYCDTQKIFFQTCSSKFLLFADKRTALVISALIDHKNHPVTPQEIMHLSNTLSAEDKAVIMKDRAYIPAKLRSIIEVICR